VGKGFDWGRCCQRSERLGNEPWTFVAEVHDLLARAARSALEHERWMEI
jgi:hypothetical protein